MRHFCSYATLFLVLCLPLFGLLQVAKAQSPDGLWTEFENITKTPFASIYPTVVADSSGNVHVLWSEDVGGKTSAIQYNADGTPMRDSRGNIINYLWDAGNTLYYIYWDGESWSEPRDIVYNPVGSIGYPRAVVDKNGILQVVWAGSQAENVRLYYSHVQADKAYSSRDWSEPVILAEPTPMLYYPMDITADLTGGLHIFYVQLGKVPGAYVINSIDGGATWSDPVQLFITQDPTGNDDGISTMRIITDQKNRLHTTWSRYNAEGNGSAVYYSQSLDMGETWSKPFMVAAWQPGWYETDWLSAGVIGDEIHLVWEGGVRAFLNERISEDGGQTWGENQRILPNLVGENGFADLVIDSSNKLHMLVTKRGTQADSVHGIWYSTLEKDRWADPELLGTRNLLLYWKMDTLSSQDALRVLRGTFTGGYLRYQIASVLNGNEIVVVVVNEGDGEIWSSRGALSSRLIAPQPYPKLTATPTETIVPTIAIVTAAPTPLPANLRSGAQVDPGGPSNTLLLGLVPAVLIILAYIVYLRFFKR
jgi:hypothetical protein